MSFDHFVLRSKFSVLVELWKVFDPFLMGLQGFCRTKSPRELEKRAVLVPNRADTSLKTIVVDFGWKKKHQKVTIRKSFLDI